MTDRISGLLQGNKDWAENKAASEEGFFDRLAAGQSPKFLWIGCADSRVPANVICGVDPGQVFVHRNIANVVVHSDLNCLSVIQYAVEVLKVTNVIVCGHYGCGGVAGALGTTPLGLIDNWLYNIKDVYLQHREELEQADLSPEDRVNRLCELNVQAQLKNVAATTIVQGAWSRGQELSLHGLVYGLSDGRLKVLGDALDSSNQLPEIYRMG